MAAVSLHDLLPGPVGSVLVVLTPQGTSVVIDGASPVQVDDVLQVDLQWHRPNAWHRAPANIPYRELYVYVASAPGLQVRQMEHVQVA